MKAFLASRIRNILILKMVIPVAICVLVVGGLFGLVAALTAAILAPIETAQNAVSSFFGGGDSDDAEQALDLRTCLTIDPISLSEIVSSVPPRTELDLAWAWIAWRSQETSQGKEPAYDSVITFEASPAGLQTRASVDTDPEEISRTFADTVPADYTLAAITGVIDLVQRGILTAPDEETITELSAVLSDTCSSS